MDRDLLDQCDLRLGLTDVPPVKGLPDEASPGVKLRLDIGGRGVSKIHAHAIGVDPIAEGPTVVYTFNWLHVNEAALTEYAEEVLDGDHAVEPEYFADPEHWGESVLLHSETYPWESVVGIVQTGPLHDTVTEHL